MAKLLMKSQTTVLHIAISPVSKLTSIWSPEVFIHGIPWKILVKKHEEEHSLALYLHCAKKSNSSNWAVPAFFTMYLMPFSGKVNAHVHHISPYAFNAFHLACGHTSFIQWDDLLKDENLYVKDDTIELQIEIMAEDPNNLDKAILKFDTIDKSCDCGSYAVFRLAVKNVENLLAVRSSKFILRGLPWDLTVYKNQLSTLGIMLDLIESIKNVSCKISMSVKLLSSKNGIDPIEKSISKSAQRSNTFNVKNIIAWDEMMKSENGFVNDNSITLEVEIRVAKPEGDVPNQPKSLKRPHSAITKQTRKHTHSK